MLPHGASRWITFSGTAWVQPGYARPQQWAADGTAVEPVLDVGAHPADDVPVGRRDGVKELVQGSADGRNTWLLAAGHVFPPASRRATVGGSSPYSDVAAAAGERGLGTRSGRHGLPPI